MTLEEINKLKAELKAKMEEVRAKLSNNPDHNEWEELQNLMRSLKEEYLEAEKLQPDTGQGFAESLFKDEPRITTNDEFTNNLGINKPRGVN